MTKDQARRDLEAFAEAALARLVERDGARFFCEFCSPAKPATVHGDDCPVNLVLPLLRPKEPRRGERTLDDPLPLSADGTLPRKGN